MVLVLRDRIKVVRIPLEDDILVRVQVPQLTRASSKIASFEQKILSRILGRSGILGRRHFNLYNKTESPKTLCKFKHQELFFIALFYLRYTRPFMGVRATLEATTISSTFAKRTVFFTIFFGKSVFCVDRERLM